MYYYEKLEDGGVGRYTNSHVLAQKYGWTGQTESEPIMYQNKLYLQDDFEAYKLTDEYKALQNKQQEHKQINPLMLDMAETIVALNDRITKLEGGTK